MKHLTFSLPVVTLVPGATSKTPSLRLEADFSLVFRGETYFLAKGFVTDGASIPPYLRLICGSPFAIPRLYAAMVHDYLYSGCDSEATRADADDLYRDLQIALGIPRFKAYIEWAALRLFGKSHWCGQAI